MLIIQNEVEKWSTFVLHATKLIKLAHTVGKYCCLVHPAGKTRHASQELDNSPNIFVISTTLRVGN